jgi:hypothetical protein
MSELYEAIHADPTLEFPNIVAALEEMNCRFITDFLHFLKCWRNKLGNHALKLLSYLEAFTGPAIGDVLGAGDALNRKTDGTQLRDSTALKVFSLENLNVLLANNLHHAAFYFLPMVCWRIAIQAKNLSRDGRFWLLWMAFEAARVFDSLLDSSGVPQTGPIGSTTSFCRKEDAMKFLSSLPGVALALYCGPLVKLGRAGTSGLEHLFGVTRVAARGSNNPNHIRARLAKAHLKKNFFEKFGFKMPKTNGTSIGGTVCDAAHEGEDIVEVEIESPKDSVRALYAVVIGQASAEQAMLVERLKDELIRLLGALQLGEDTEVGESVLSGAAIFSRLTAVERAQQHAAAPQTFYWSGAHKMELARLMAQNCSDEAMMHHFGITVEKLNIGKMKVAKLSDVFG